MRELKKINRKLADFVHPKIINQESSFKKGSPQSRPVITFPITHSQTSKILKKGVRRRNLQYTDLEGPLGRMLTLLILSRRRKIIPSMVQPLRTRA